MFSLYSSVVVSQDQAQAALFGIAPSGCHHMQVQAPVSSLVIHWRLQTAALPWGTALSACLCPLGTPGEREREVERRSKEHYDSVIVVFLTRT